MQKDFLLCLQFNPLFYHKRKDKKIRLKFKIICQIDKVWKCYYKHVWKSDTFVLSKNGINALMKIKNMCMI